MQKYVGCDGGFRSRISLPNSDRPGERQPSGRVLSAVLLCAVTSAWLNRGARCCIDDRLSGSEYFTCVHRGGARLQPSLSRRQIDCGVWAG